ncbi:hypothetical protein RI845_13370 [Thalassotalea nanhaiensis]|uniref:Carrier domain-containing protein n=1 Tax=Thalassotalea nanhaiensis TaxID=3065648 RepID=A0ABY9TFF3_9GAMM|nr:hypothetical protein RI845_13370 [Colwelliaceae bacterium SQ345]
MNKLEAEKLVRQCLQRVNSSTDFNSISNATPLLENRLITSFQVLDLLLLLEQSSGNRIVIEQLTPGCFKTISIIANTFYTLEACDVC